MLFRCMCSNFQVNILSFHWSRAVFLCFFCVCVFLFVLFCHPLYCLAVISANQQCFFRRSNFFLLVSVNFNVDTDTVLTLTFASGLCLVSVFKWFIHSIHWFVVVFFSFHTYFEAARKCQSTLGCISTLKKELNTVFNTLNVTLSLF